MTPRTFGKISLRRNEVIADVFSRTSYVEKVASGIKRIRDLCKEENIKIKYTFDGFVELVFYKNKVSDSTLNDTLNIKKTTQEKILDIIKINPKVTKDELAQNLKLSISGVEKIFRQLKKENIIERIASDKQGKWLIKSK